MTWTRPDESLPSPGDGRRYLTTVDWGYGRELQLAVVRFDPTPGLPERGIWRLAVYPHRHIPRDKVTAWMPAPEPYPNPNAVEKEGAA